ncbi:hypothetical protein DYH09_05410 [bacterium CPR1]|nr:hypothetical protein [bacterium CPR1]
MKLCYWVLFLLLTLSPALAELPLASAGAAGGESFADRVLVARASLLEGRERARAAMNGLLGLQPTTTLEQAVLARALGEGAVHFSGQDASLSASLAQQAERELEFLTPWLADYPALMKVHGFEEPAWLRGQSDTVAHALLAWVAVDKLDPRPDRRKIIQQFAEGLVLLQRKSTHLYPYGAHVSFYPSPELEPYAPTPDGQLVPGVSWILQNSPQVEALVAAGTHLSSPALIQSAEVEGLGMLAHVVASGKLAYGYLPRPQDGGSSRGALVLIENLVSLEKATGRPVYAVLAGMAAGWARPGSNPAEQAAAQLADSLLKGLPAERYRPVEDLQPPFSYQVMDAENGKAVIKAFDVMDVTYPGGFPGKLVTVGREQMFWMRFDVDREDEYYFYLVCLKTTQAGLVSVAMRIDGDKIFTVQLGGATDSSFVDLAFVAGPRRLRSGPHSFGIRFSGLLMKQPAILDAVIVQPVVERRLVKLKDGEHLLLLKNLKPEATATVVTECDPSLARVVASVDGTGQSFQPTTSVDRKGKKRLNLPAGGVVALQFRR